LPSMTSRRGEGIEDPNATIQPINWASVAILQSGPNLTALMKDNARRAGLCPVIRTFFAESR
jgi:hypothetical protein